MTNNISPEEKAKNIQNMFNNISWRYDLLNRVLSFRRDVRWRKLSIRKLDPQNSDTILDLACGTGDMILTLRKLAPKSVIIGGDFSLQMLKMGQKKVTEQLVAADATCLPFADKSFDKVTMAFGFRNVTDKPKALREIHRVLKDGGKMCILEFSQPKSKIFSKLYWFYFKQVLPRVGALVSKSKDAYTYLPQSVENFPREEAYRQMIAEAGFKDLTLTWYDFGICNAAIAKRG
ncbi:MAG: bifunctional demethylmenaquinone methyltransferase/2-methoxy-6-polyprenyl-1,4-benzoquinol methylase UbiE [Deferribacteraceae bacterium]|jgi:demethylmenaquinone methyltransferase/2-methoxy-6-polyprenyl-1,4-benzoquinol methylase|nr:bifunctional demethylmenaquinone methyltransferase/2-methoxy-6-polyprenyl-1,4-benzoquinol methylase UbiE [Deferribacteraceae bacterium]